MLYVAPRIPKYPQSAERLLTLGPPQHSPHSSSHAKTPTSSFFSGKSQRHPPLQTPSPTQNPDPSKVSLPLLMPLDTLSSVLLRMQHLGAKLMHFLPASRTKRNLIKIASLGLAGLIAGLLSGCTGTASASVPANHSFETSSDGQSPNLPTSIEATQIPALRHPPSSRSLQAGTVHTAASATNLPGHSHS
jgi:hypothetical protein